MNKAVMASIQPYYVFVIIAKYMGWNIPQDKKVELRKNFPKDKDWNKKVNIYCSKNKKSFNRIPKEYQPLMRPFLGKVIGAFICDNVETYDYGYCDGVDIDDDTIIETMLDREEINIYAKGKNLYGWHISQLKIYDKPRELSVFRISRQCKEKDCEKCNRRRGKYTCDKRLNHPFQSWGYVEELEVKYENT